MAGFAAPPPILETSAQPPPFQGQGDFAATKCQNKKFLVDDPPRYEWTPMQDGDNPIVGLSGFGYYIPDQGSGLGISGRDVRFTHPFGFDWEFFVAPDIRYTTLLGPGNNATTGEYGQASAIARARGPYSGGGVLGVELDQGLMPASYRVIDGSRVAVFGTWVADCGHPDNYHTEIHPPLLIVQAQASGPNKTHTSVINRPFTVTQEFGDGALRQHLVNEYKKINAFPIPLSTKVEAHVQVSPMPFHGTKSLTWTVRPPSARNFPEDSLEITFNFTVRTGVVVGVAQANDEITVHVVMNDQLYHAPPLPHSVSSAVFLHELAAEDADAAKAIGALVGLSKFFNPLAPITEGFLAQGISYDSFDRPTPKPQTGKLTLGKVLLPFTIDDTQPFPIYGWLDVNWVRWHPMTGHPHPLPPPPERSEHTLRPR